MPGTHTNGETFTLIGETNLPAGQEIEYGIFSASFAPGSPDLLPPTFDGAATTVVPGTVGSLPDHLP